ncbi:MAG: UxaA family hydrolase [Geminicoccaceae bacterium]|nr:UxaA family hydrolase [Geminicoccaceae bacterium]
MRGWLRSDGRKGIRNTIIVTYLVECAHHVAREIVRPFEDEDVHLIGFPGCFANLYAFDMMERLATHPNVAGVLLVSLGCEGFDRSGLARRIEATGRPVRTLVIQREGGTRKTVDAGRAWVRATCDGNAALPRVEMGIDELVVGTICGGSDGTSGLTANPAMGNAFDRLVEKGAACIFEETGELIGCEHHMAGRAVTPELGAEIIKAIDKAARYYGLLGQGSFAPGNAEGGLTTIEEKSLGAYAKAGTVPIDGMIKPGTRPPSGGLYLMDVVPDGELRFGYPNINDNAEIVELIASGCHIILFSTGRGSVVGSAISPVIKVCANPLTYRRMADDMDVNAGRILEEQAGIEDVGAEIVQLVERVADGERTMSEALGHREFILNYKTFEPVGPACLPKSAA